MKSILESTAKVRFQDCDPFNHLNNSNYISYFINAREDQVLEHYELDIFEHIREFDKSWVVASNQIRYVKPAHLMEEVLIESQVIHFSKSTLSVEMKMWDKSKKNLKAIFWSTFVYFDIRTNKKTTHPEDFTKLFSQVITPVEDRVFEQRCNTILEGLKTKKASELMDK